MEHIILQFCLIVCITNFHHRCHAEKQKENYKQKSQWFLGGKNTHYTLY